MENLVPLLVVAAVVYRIYSEYRKEQEKAQRRAIRQPAVPLPQNVPTAPFPEPRPSASVWKEPRTAEIVRKEVKKAEPNKKAHEQEALASLRSEKPTFDLREAVIQSVILEKRF